MTAIPIFSSVPPHPQRQWANLESSHNNQVLYNNEQYGTSYDINKNALDSRENQLISNIFLDIRVATDVCKNLFMRVKELEN
jgi:hypothetical protein